MKFARRAKQEVDVNLTPLIDVVFLLLIFFMVSTTFTKESRLGINLPKAEQAAKVEESVEKIEVVIDRSGNYSVNGVALTNNDLAALKEALTQSLVGLSEIPQMVITADAATPHQSVISAMDVAGQIGFSKLNIATLKASKN